jgi:hypothetical protein
MRDTFDDPLVRKLATFVSEIGIRTIAASSASSTLFPGLDIQCGAVLIDESRLVHPGDILHEAGHLAVTEPQFRNAARLNPTGGQELSALAWSYAAAMHLGLDAGVVFYPESYHDTGDSLVEQFASGRYIGVPLLQTYGMSAEPHRAAQAGIPPFPHMTRWLR